jgi:uracil-DNA glycosylase
MCFSVNPGVPVPPSLQNIFKELHDDLGCYIPDNGYLMPWAKQGVFLLNTVMTVEDSHPLAHANKGWETFTDHAIQKLNARETADGIPAVGPQRPGQGRHDRQPRGISCCSAPHPSPLSASYGFFGCRHFSKANAFLKEKGIAPVDWQIPNIHVQ